MKSLRLQKIRRICEILAFTENQSEDRILAALKSPSLAKNPHFEENPRLKKSWQDWKSRRPA
jgi:hypothetical protein